MTEEAAGRRMWMPSGVEQIGEGGLKANALLMIAGTSGVGKSHLGYQLIRDEDYGPDEVCFLMAEDATTTYDPPPGTTINVKRVRTLWDLDTVTTEIIRESQAGTRMPKVFFYDSLSGGCDYSMMDYEENPILTKVKADGSGGQRDKLAEYGDLGMNGIRTLVRLRDGVAADVVVLCTTFEPAGGVPELALPGKVIPKNLTRLTNVTLYMKADRVTFDPANPPKLVEAPHRTIGRNETGVLTGEVVNRFFYTMNTGEIQAKGHHNLALRERAVLPDVLRKIHGGHR